ncbi:MAG: CHASE2 domain-containing protein [Defluviicoccus sp.]
MTAGIASKAGRASALVDVFISYAREDRDRAMGLVDALERAGRSVWWDVSIPAGSNWHKEITRRLAQAKCVIVLWSATSIYKEFVTDEAEQGKRQEKLIPVLIDPVDPPLGFGRRQCANLVGWQGEWEFPDYQILLRAITEKIDGQPDAELGADQPAPVGLADVAPRPLFATGAIAPASQALRRAHPFVSPVATRVGISSPWLRWLLYSAMAVAILWIDPFGAFAATQRLSQDSANRIFGPLYPPTGRDQVSVILWRDSSLATLKLTWPIPLARHARALSAILTYRPKAVFVDIVYSNDRGDVGVEQLRETIGDYADARIPLLFAAPSNAGEAIIPALSSALPDDKLAGVPRPIEDGVTRTYPEEVKVGTAIYKTAAFRLLQLTDTTDDGMQALSDRMRRSIEIVWGTEPHPINKEIIGDCASSAPETPAQRLLAAFVRPGALMNPCPNAPTIPIQAILDSTRDQRFAALIENRIVILGTAVQSVPDEVTTPVNGRLPGAHLHAMALDNLLTFGERYKSREPGALFKAVKAVTVVLMLAALLAEEGRRGGAGDARSWLRATAAVVLAVVIGLAAAVLSFAVLDLPPADWMGTLGLALTIALLARAGLVETVFNRGRWSRPQRAKARMQSS